MTQACDLLEAELALDHLEAELAAELPAYLRVFAAAYASGAPLPAPPAATRRIAAVRHALAHPLLADRALVLARMMFPIAIEDDVRVLAARAAPRTWDALAALTAAREAAARDRFGIGFFPLMHRLFGVTRDVEDVPWPAPIEAWHATYDDVDRSPRPDREPRTIWEGLAARFGVAGKVLPVLADVHARTVVVEPQRHVIVIARPPTSPATQFALVHELGHALAGLLAPAGLPRVVDEAVAAWTARLFEDDLAVCARQRRLQLAKALDAIERGHSHARPTEHPPWALWHDPGAQAAYVEAEAIADRWAAGPIELARAIAHERARIDATTTL